MAERRNPGRGTCRVCGDEFNLTSNGRIRSHGPRDNRCDGGSDLPAETRPETAAKAGPNPHRAPLDPNDRGPGISHVSLDVPDASPTIRGSLNDFLPVKEALSEIKRREALGDRFDPSLPPVEALKAHPKTPVDGFEAVQQHNDNLNAITDSTQPVQPFTTAVPVSQTPTVRGGESVRPGPEKSDFDQWGRYKIPDPATGAVSGRQRVTTFAKMISDQWGLSQWQQRKLLIGAAENPAITAVAAGKDAKSDKAFLDGLADTLKEAAGSKEAAAHGTLVHKLTERYDMGLMALGEIDNDSHRADVCAYVDAVGDAGLTVLPEMVERTTMARSLDVVGTLDRIFRLPNGEYVIGDVKTGADLSYGWLDIGVQLACYAYGVNENGVFDWGSRQWIPAPKVRTDFAIVMHMPAGKGTCTLYRVNIEQGWANCALARSIRDARKVRNHAEILDLDSIRTPGPENTMEAALSDTPHDCVGVDQCEICGAYLRPPVAPVDVESATSTEERDALAPSPLTVQPHSESFAGPDPARFSTEDMSSFRDRMRRVRTQVFAGELYQQAYDAGAPAEFLQKLAFIGTEVLEKRDRACRAMAEVTSQGAARELYGYAAEVWPDDAEFLGELAAIGMNALTVAGYQVMS